MLTLSKLCIYIYTQALCICSYLSIYLSISVHNSLSLFISIFTNPSARAGYDTRSIFKRSLTGLNSVFLLDCSYLSIYLSIYLFISILMDLYSSKYIHLSVCLPVCLSLSLSLYIYIYIYALRRGVLSYCGQFVISSWLTQTRSNGHQPPYFSGGKYLKRIMDFTYRG